jgi:hypothetical protein
MACQHAAARAVPKRQAIADLFTSISLKLLRKDLLYEEDFIL